MDNKDTAGKPSEEVDVAQFFRWIGRGFSRATNGLLFSLIYLRATFTRNKTLFIAFIIGGLILGVCYHRLLKKPYYRATMVLNCNMVDYQVFQNIIDRLTLLCEEDSREILAEELDISQDTAKLVYRFSIDPFVSQQDIIELELLKEELKDVTIEKKATLETVLKGLESHNDRTYEISIFVYDHHIIKSIEKSIINFFRNNEFIKRRLDIDRQGLIARKEKLEQESKKLDSLKIVLFENFQNLSKTSRAGSNNVILADDKLTNPLDVFKEDLIINNEIISIQKTLFLEPNFEVIKGFTTISQPANLSLPKILVIAFFASIVAAYLAIALWQFDKMLVDFEKRRNTA
jgi:hypothetical protein